MLEEIINELHSKALIVLVLWIIPLIAYFVDFWTGIEAAKAQGERIHSHKLRNTFNKVGEYWRFQLMAGLIDTIGCLLPFYDLPYISMIATISVILVEYRSVRENFKKKRSGIIDAMGFSERFIGDIVNAKSREDAVKTIAKIADEFNNK